MSSDIEAFNDLVQGSLNLIKKKKRIERKLSGPAVEIGVPNVGDLRKVLEEKQGKQDRPDNAEWDYIYNTRIKGEP